MTQIRRFAASCLAIAVLASGCASAPLLYHPSKVPGGVGFSETALGDNMYRVTFKGDTQSTRATVEDYLLLRAAELARDQGKLQFTIMEASTDREIHIQTTRYAPIYGRRHTIIGTSGAGFPFYASGYSWSPEADWGMQDVGNFVAVAYVSLNDDASGARFNADTILKTIGPVSCYKTAPHDDSGCPFDHDH